MKKELLLLSFFIGFLVPHGHGQCIADANFKQAINSQCDPCIDNQGCLTPLAETWTQLDVTNSGIVNISGIEGFTHLQHFYCSRNDIVIVPPLPDSLELFYCNENQITTLPATLPINLEDFKCDSNMIAALPPLPDGLKSLFCSNNLLTGLPALPATVEKLSCNDNFITQLPALPESLTTMHCNSNPLKKLPELPASLEKLYCEQDSLSSLPELPAGLNLLDVSLNPISCLPELPYDLQFFDYSNTYISCLPNMIGISITLPLCVNDGDSSCALNPEVTGMVYVDFNGNHIQNADDFGLPGLNVLSNIGNWIGYTNSNGAFRMNTGFDSTFNIAVALPATSYTVYPPLGYSLVFDDTTFQKIGNINFAAHPNANTYDLELVVTPGPAIPGIQTNYYLTYKNNCPVEFDGLVQMEYDNNMSFVNSDVPPSSQSGNTLFWNFLSLGPFNSQTITVTFNISSSVIAGTELDVLASGSIVGFTDVFPDNNYAADSSTVLGVALQNYLTVDKGFITPAEVASGAPLDYTIHFQNKGSTVAQNVEIFDTLSSSLMAAGFEVLATSHPGTFELSNDVNNLAHPLILHWKFSDINLPAAANDPLASRGFVKFRTIPLPTLSVGSVINDKAYIQFSNSDGVLITNLVNTYVSNTIFAGSPYKEGMELNVFPNPSESIFNVEMKFPAALNFDMKIYNSLGEIVWEKALSSSDHANVPVDLHELPAGPYLLKVTGDKVSGAAKIWKL